MSDRKGSNDARLIQTVIEEMRERAREHRQFPGVPCQSESSWHADELEGWADTLSALAGGAPQGRCILNLDSPSYPPETDEYRQCGCKSCLPQYAKLAQQEIARLTEERNAIQANWDEEQVQLFRAEQEIARLKAELEKVSAKERREFAWAEEYMATSRSFELKLEAAEVALGKVQELIGDFATAANACDDPKVTPVTPGFAYRQAAQCLREALTIAHLPGRATLPQPELRRCVGSCIAASGDRDSTAICRNCDGIGHHGFCR